MGGELRSELDMERLEALKSEANALFASADYTQASEMYYKILAEVLPLTSSQFDAECVKNQAKKSAALGLSTDLNAFLATVACNMAICQNRMKRPREARLMFESALAFDEGNYKANYHLAHSHLADVDYNTALFHIQQCQKAVNSSPQLWKNRSQPHLELMGRIRNSVKQSDVKRDHVSDPDQLVAEIASGCSVNLNLQRLQLVPSKRLAKSEALVSLAGLCRRRLDDGLVDDTLSSLWSCLYYVLYKCEDEFKQDLRSQFLSKFSSSGTTLCQYVRTLLNLNAGHSDSEVASVLGSVLKLCPLVKGVDALEVLQLLLESERPSLELVLTSILLFFSKTKSSADKEANSAFNSLLSKLLQRLLWLCDADTYANQHQLSACLVSIFQMQFDPYEVSLDSFASMINMALEPYVETDLDAFDGRPVFSFQVNWYLALGCLSMANKTLFKSYMVLNQFVKHVATVYVKSSSRDLRKRSFELLLNCVDFVDFRQQVLDYTHEGVPFLDLLNSPEMVRFKNSLVDSKRESNSSDDNGCVDRPSWFVQSTVLMFTKLSLHSPQVKDEVLNCFNFFALIPKLAAPEVKFDRAVLLPALSFASLHEEFKSADLSFLPTLLNESSNADVSAFLLLQVVSNLLRGNKDRNSFVEDLEMAKYDSEQLSQLKRLEERLPPEAKSTANANYFEGNDESANMARSRVFELSDSAVPKYLAKAFKALDSERAKWLLVESLHYLALNVNHRRYLQSLGVMRIFISVANSPKYQPGGAKTAAAYRSMRSYKLIVQSIAHLTIATDPSNLLFNDAHDTIKPLMNLLGDDNELFQYEAALALTNLLSINDDVRKRVFALGGWDKFSELLFSDNDMLKTAGLEGWCNLCAGDDVVHGHFYRQFTQQVERMPPDKVYDLNVHDVNIMLMFVSTEVSPAALSASAGALALLVRDSRIAQYMPFVSRFVNVLKTLDATQEPPVLHRLLTILSCVVQSRLRDSDEPNQSHVDSVFENIRSSVTRNSHKYVNKTLLDLFHEIS